MPKRPQLPPWLEILYSELTKPPYFIQANLEDKQSGQSDASNDQKNPSSHAASQSPDEKESTQAHGRHSHQGRRNDNDIRPASTASGKESKSHSSRSNEHQSTLFVPTPVLDRYSFEVASREQHQAILRIETKDNQHFAVKRTTLPAQRVRFLNRALNYAKKQGFRRFAPFVLSKKKSPAVTYDGNVYYATEWVTGQPANFASTEQVAQVAYTLAQFHEATRGFTSESYAPSSAFDLFAMTKQRNHDLHQMMYRAEAKDNKDEFDSLFVSMKSDLFDDSAESLQLLQKGDCEAFLAQEEEQPGLCHLDVIPGNCLYTPNHNVVLIDFDLTTFAPRALDIAHLLRRSLERSNWNSDMAYACFLHFNTVKALPKTEYRLIESLIRFPYQAWRIAHTRHHFFASEDQIESLQAYADQMSRRKSFLDSLSNQIDHLSVGQSN